MIENPNPVDVIVSFGEEDYVEWDDGEGHKDKVLTPFEEYSGTTIAANEDTSLILPAPSQTPFIYECKITCTFSHINHKSATETIEI